MKKWKRLSALLIAGIITASGAACGGNNSKATDAPTATVKPTDKPADATNPPSGGEATETPTDPTEAPPAASGDPVVIRIGHNWAREMDTNFRDPITGDKSMGEEEWNARVYAEAQVLEKLNVKFEFVQYPGDLQEDILRSVLAGDPIADLVRVVGAAQGTLLGQNVIQPLDDYANLFADEDSSWMYWGKAFDHNYFLNNVLRYGNDAPLCYNIGMLEKVDALKVDGKTKLPVDYWKEGTWTWSVFEDYLQKVNDYWIQDWDGRIAYDPDYQVLALMAIHSNGGAVYGDDGLAYDSPEAKEAVAYVERLMTKGLVKDVDIIGGTSETNGLMNVWRFQWGHSVFSNLQQWLAGDMVGQFNERGETMGIVPFPRPDHLAADDPAYQQLNDAKDCFAVPRGVSKDKVELAVKAFREYTLSYYKKLANSDRCLDYLQSDAAAKSSAMKMFLDITNDDYGQDLLDVWKFLGSNENLKVNEYARNVGLYGIWGRYILGDSLYGINGAAKYSTQADASLGQVNEILNTTRAALSGSDLIDNIAPRFNDVDGSTYIFAAGTDPASVDWKSKVTAWDNVDGDLDTSKASFDFSAADFNTPGVYNDGIKYTISDAAGNSGTTGKQVLIYDGASTTPPSMELHGEPRALQVDEDANNVNWKDDFVWYANDKDGIDLKSRVTVDLSELDTTTAGEYNVIFTVTDYAGNTYSVEKMVRVEK